VTGKLFNVLFVCAGNSARSIMAEAILNHVSSGRFRAGSAGFAGTGQIHPLAIEQLKRSRLDVSGLGSKSWGDFAVPGADPLDLVITFDPIEKERLPEWPGQPLVVFWRIDDPVLVEGGGEEAKRAFALCFQLLNRRISLFASLPLDRLDRVELKRRLEDIGSRSPAA
jgi:protein-tyrosine-phosphatase